MKEGVLEDIAGHRLLQAKRAREVKFVDELILFLCNASLHDDGQRRILKTPDFIELLFDLVDFQSSLYRAHSLLLLRNLCFSKVGMAIGGHPKFASTLKLGLVDNNSEVNFYAISAVYGLMLARYGEVRNDTLMSHTMKSGPKARVTIRTPDIMAAVHALAHKASRDHTGNSIIILSISI